MQYCGNLKHTYFSMCLIQFIFVLNRKKGGYHDFFPAELTLNAPTPPLQKKTKKTPLHINGLESLEWAR